MEKFKVYNVEELSKKLSSIYENAASLDDNDERLVIGQIILDEDKDIIVDVYLTHYKSIISISTDINDYSYILEDNNFTTVSEDLLDDLCSFIYQDEEALREY